MSTRRHKKPAADHPWRGYARLGLAQARKSAEQARAAAVHLGTGSVLDDPFNPTADIHLAATVGGDPEHR